jgi:aspartyl-tRNA synthetase
MIEAFSYGAPPHGGIALGVDRNAMCLAGEDSMREVVAFPMTSSGNTAVMDAPSDLDVDTLTELGIHVTPKKD